MAIKQPFTELEIKKAPSGFYEGNSLPIALISKSIMVGTRPLGVDLARQCQFNAGQLEWPSA